MGRLVYLSGDTDKPLALVGELCPRQLAATPLGWQQAWLAGEVLGEMGLPRVRESALGRDLLERVQGRLVELLAANALTPVERAKAGVALGRLGDPRPGVGLRKDGLPDLDFTTTKLPPGKFTLGGTGQAVIIEQPYHLSRYPVTVAQFQAFVAAGGYDDDRSAQATRRLLPWWGKDGLQWKRGRNITGPEDYDLVFQTPNHPRVGVSWYEATAFCEWLTEQWRANGQLPPAHRVMLPSEAQWEQAARWNERIGRADDRLYPWGGKDDKDLALRCNMVGTGIGHTSAVGLFPSGKADSGALDMSGNVWEWCRNWYDENSKNCRVLRGGSWGGLSPEAPRCSYRYIGTPDVRRQSRGFRCVWWLGVSAPG